MKINPKHLKGGAVFPFHLWSPDGRLLLRSGLPITGNGEASRLASLGASVKEADYQNWLYAYKKKADQLFREGDSLNNIVNAEPDSLFLPSSYKDEGNLITDWNSLIEKLTCVYRSHALLDDSFERIQLIQQRLVQITRRHLDSVGVLSTLALHEQSNSYTACHALACASMCVRVADNMDWPDELISSITIACLLMNLSIHKGMDSIRTHTFSVKDRVPNSVQLHPVHSASTAKRLGLNDSLAIDFIINHHKAEFTPHISKAEGSAVTANLLIQLCDAVVEEMGSTRKTPSMLRTIGRFVMDQSSRLTVLGRAYMDAFGLYPPGLFVKLKNGEIGVVVSRGPNISAPLIKTVYTSSLMPVFEPASRDTSIDGLGILTSIAPEEIKVMIDLKKLIGHP